MHLVDERQKVTQLHLAVSVLGTLGRQRFHATGDAIGLPTQRVVFPQVRQRVVLLHHRWRVGLVLAEQLLHAVFQDALASPLAGQLPVYPCDGAMQQAVALGGNALAPKGELVECAQDIYVCPTLPQRTQAAVPLGRRRPRTPRHRAVAAPPLDDGTIISGTTLERATAYATDQATRQRVVASESQL